MRWDDPLSKLPNQRTSPCVHEDGAEGVESCSFCRRRKVKCDKMRPCSRCVSSGRHLECMGSDLTDLQQDELVDISEEQDGEIVLPQKRRTPDTSETFYDLPASESFESFAAHSSEQLYVLRPLQTAMHLYLRDPISGQVCSCDHLLPQLLVKAFWQAGYNKTLMVKMFHDMPSPVRTAFFNGLHAIERIATSANMGEFAAMRCQQSAANGHSIFNIDDLRESVSSQANLGYWIMEIDPNTMISSGIATFLNMHPDEMLARLGNCDNWLPHSELEFFGSMAYETVKLLDSRIVRNLRILRRCPRSGKLIDPFLVRLTSMKERDAYGRVTRAMHVLQRLTPEEYDLACINEPETCRPLMDAIGDARGGEELLETANYDSLFTQSFMTLNESVQVEQRGGEIIERNLEELGGRDLTIAGWQGLQHTQQLTAKIQQLFAPFVDFAISKKLLT
ncbi:hypothetical protein GUITHDRAFT_113574 [Guillardia theta CCMP2712]|uniref:Zn(2)-C6 fungal-type domain-containing protein n=1 Tax=Guillardia theta (strain CCMP2712) TaxID=905079 RepID=L1IVR4_GUITC|nr:hypothetical protein GUITHDRAFT_113574 [Guillardia theta CCMP2712]EKX40338.1 hypothetical protein GUITHDRAFT_113574 [Guillardia theta CCMP2712]|eukprot:XP_005827318.1 hypothetical protein GUITHDRAFT_113574 [Guillardia theta CCMP2712]